ncbi:MAG: alpha-hydroxy acid oxidase [Burkholderiaceae bacterium]
MLNQALRRAQSIDDLRRIARRRLPRAIFEFIDGGAEDEITLSANRRDFEAISLLPRVLVDVDAPELATMILGRPAGAPLIISPMGSCSLVWPDADLAIARAAKAMNIPHTLSTMASSTIERLAEQVGGRLWFQLYVLRDMAFNLRLLDRARDAGYEALVITVDLAVGGKRERDLRNGITIPLKPSLRLALDTLRHPRWLAHLATHGSPRYDNVRELFDADQSGLTIAAMVGRNLDAGFDWDDLARLRDRWPNKLVIKGVQRADDAQRLLALGADAIWVSNHGGRQLDGAASSISSVAAIADALDGRAEVFVDSGVRRGMDMLRARTLGAQAVAIGRPALFGAACGGDPGARHALGILTDELRRAMQLSGVARLTDADQSLLAPQVPGWARRRRAGD